MEGYDAELRQDRAGWAVVVFPAEGAPRVVYHSFEKGAPGVYRAEGVADFLATRPAEAEVAWKDSQIPWKGR